jgi:hypothetical protein
MIRSSNIGAERAHLPLQIGQGLFENSAVTGISAALKLFSDALERQTEVFFLTELSRSFPRQARLFG